MATDELAARSAKCSEKLKEEGEPLERLNSSPYSTAMLGWLGLTPLLAEALLVPEETHQLAGLLSHVGALISAVAVHVLEVT
ncbi:hypothetical protein EYF80_018775 [Liparis tanakae]|uniref:Uncharacterized protein n=1 Tax=Liparis tanakae TaxID=230148 RepID=A0A4Z2HYM5_9TELE|nr:hypothetical protein EYF80_018775 [Liparis tanakae]